jgi:hypothetical protein
MATTIGLKGRGLGGNPADFVDGQDLGRVAGSAIGSALSSVQPVLANEDTYDHDLEPGMDNNPTPRPGMQR